MFRHQRDKPQYRCSFCGKSQEDVRRLIAGPGAVYICDECVELCHEISVYEGDNTIIAGETGDQWSYEVRNVSQEDGSSLYEPRLVSTREISVPAQEGLGIQKWQNVIIYEARGTYQTVKQARMALKHLMEHEKISDHFDLA